MRTDPDLFCDCKPVNQRRQDEGELSPDAFSEIQGQLCDVCRIAIEWDPKNREDEEIVAFSNTRSTRGANDYFEYDLKHHVTRESLDRSINQNCFICVALWRKIQQHGLEAEPWLSPVRCSFGQRNSRRPEDSRHAHIICVEPQYDGHNRIDVIFSSAEAIGGSFDY